MKLYKLEHIDTPRLRIRFVQVGDEVELYQAVHHSLPTLRRWVTWAKDINLVKIREFIERAVTARDKQQAPEFPMVAIHKQTQKIVAASGFNENSDVKQAVFEIGYWIDSQYQGHGIVTEIVNALTRYALQALHAKQVRICMQAENSKSAAVARRCGYVLQTITKNDRIDCGSGQPADSFIFTCDDETLLPPLAVSWQHHL